MHPDAVRHLIDTLCGLTAAIPGTRLTAEVRRTLGGELLPCGPALVDQVARALAARPALFDDLPVTGCGPAHEPRAPRRWADRLLDDRGGSGPRCGRARGWRRR